MPSTQFLFNHWCLLRKETFIHRPSASSSHSGPGASTAPTTVTKPESVGDVLSGAAAVRASDRQTDKRQPRRAVSTGDVRKASLAYTLRKVHPDTFSQLWFFMAAMVRRVSTLVRACSLV